MGVHKLDNVSDMDGSSPKTVLTRFGQLYEGYGKALFHGIVDNMD